MDKNLQKLWMLAAACVLAVLIYVQFRRISFPYTLQSEHFTFIIQRPDKLYKPMNLPFRGISRSCNIQAGFFLGYLCAYYISGCRNSRKFSCKNLELMSSLR